VELPFRDRAAAGRALGDRLAQMHLVDPVVLALPRGGLAQPEVFGAIGRFYVDFHQLSDEEVVRTLASQAEVSIPAQ
jgi:predicted phosphoribosyltransferase